jgi:uncharacterized membrane protein
MNEVEITTHNPIETENVSSISPNSSRKKSWIRVFRSAPPVGDDSRHSVGATIFNALLILLGIRVPHQKLYDVQDRFVTKLKSMLRSPCRIYSGIILGSLCVLPVKLFIVMTKTYNDELLLHFVSELLLPIQYILAIFYYGSDHIQRYYDAVKPVRSKRLKRESTLTNIRDIFVDIKVENKNIDFNALIKQPCRITIRVVSLVIISTVLLAFIGSLVTASNERYKEYYTFFILSRLYGRGTIVTNVSSFAFVFYKHVKVLHIYATTLEMRKWSTQNYDRISVMLINLTRLRESIRISTNAVKNIYSTGTIAGGVVAGILVHGTSMSEAAKWGYDSFIIIGSFLILQAIIFGIIAKISLAKERIEDVTKRAEFAVKFLSRKNNADSHQITKENASTLDYRLIIDILSEEWLDFSVMGIPIHTISFIKQCVSLCSIAIIFINTGTITIFQDG